MSPMSLPLKAVAVGWAALGVPIAAAVLAVAEGVPPPHAFWPDTVVGWVTPLGFLVTLWSVWRVSATAKVDRVRKEERDEARMLAIDTKLNDFRIAVRDELNGYGRRLEKVESSETTVGMLSARMDVSQLDRTHLREGVEEIKRGLEALRRDASDHRRNPGDR